MHGVAEWIEDRLHVARDVRDVAAVGTVVNPHVAHRQSDEFGEGAGTIHTDAFGVFAQMAPAGEAIAAPPADDMTLAGDDVTDAEIVNIAADFHDPPNEFMA